LSVEPFEYEIRHARFVCSSIQNLDDIGVRGIHCEPRFPGHSLHEIRARHQLGPQQFNSNRSAGHLMPRGIDEAHSPSRQELFIGVGCEDGVHADAHGRLDIHLS